MPARPLAEWLTVLLWDLEGLKGKIIAPNMGKKNWLIDHIYCVFFCTGCKIVKTKLTFVNGQKCDETHNT